MTDFEGRKARKITRDLIISSTTLPKTRQESLDHYISHITHLHLQGKRIRKIENLEHCVGLKVLYLYDNNIRKIENLKFAKALQYLYLENNEISEIPPMNHPRLKKLFIDDNNIDCLKGLEECTHIEEITIAHQKLPKYHSLTFDAPTLDAIRHSLLSLDVSGNGITTLSPLGVLYKLRKLIACDNNIADIGEAEGIVSLPELAEANFLRNPCCAIRKYRDYIIASASDSLRSLDDIVVTQQHIVAIRGLQSLRRKIGLVGGRSLNQNDERMEFGSRDEDLQNPFEVNNPSTDHDEHSVASSNGPNTVQAEVVIENF